LKTNVKAKGDDSRVAAAELRGLWKAWMKARVKEGLSKDQAEMTADLVAICKLFDLEPEDLGVARCGCGCGCGRILGPTMTTIRVLTSIVLVLINENIELTAVDAAASPAN
jgi:hypothetical protein